MAPGAWEQWRRTPEYYRGLGYREGHPPPESGDLLVQSPYSDWFALVWGLAPNADMPKWRWMYRARPEVRRGIDTKVILAVGRGFQIVCQENQDIEHYANALIAQLNLKEVLQSAVTDLTVYGQSYHEKVRASNGAMQAHERIETPQPASLTSWAKHEVDFTRADGMPDVELVKRWVAQSQEVDRWTAQNQQPNPAKIDRPDQAEARRVEPISEEGDLVELKAVDPLFMRVNRDAFNNTIGYVQWGLTPIPISVPAEKIVFLKWMPKSWSHESAYGTSILMPVQRHVSLLIQAEEDMKIWFHQYAKPMLVVKAGVPPGKAYPMSALSRLRDSFSQRQPNTDAIVPGDVDVSVIQGGTGQTTSSFEQWANYLREKIYEALGVPSILMNLPGETVRSTSDTMLQAFITEERMIQEFVGEQFLKQVILPEVERKFPDAFKAEEHPALKIVWLPIMEEDQNKKFDRYVKGVGRPFISVNEARLDLGFPAKDEAQYDLIPEEAAGGFGQLSKGPEYSESGRTGSREEGLQKRDRGE